MSTSTAKIVELSSESTVSFDDALKAGIARASKTIEGIQGVWIKDQELLVEDGKISRYRVHMKVTFTLRD